MSSRLTDPLLSDRDARDSADDSEGRSQLAHSFDLGRPDVATNLFIAPPEINLVSEPPAASADEPRKESPPPYHIVTVDAPPPYSSTEEAKL